MLPLGLGGTAETRTLVVSPETLAAELRMFEEAKHLGQLLARAKNADTVIERFKALVELEHGSWGPQSKPVARECTRRLEVAEEKLDDLLEAAATMVPRLLLLILVVICAGGLLIPLAYLSSFGMWSKSLLLLPFGFGIVGLLFYVYRQIRGLEWVRRTEYRRLYGGAIDHPVVTQLQAWHILSLWLALSATVRMETFAGP
jgi:hypothetical protein